MKKMILGSIVVVLTAFYLFRPVPTTFYIGIANSHGSIDVQVEVDDETILNDTVTFGIFNYLVLEKEMRAGVHHVVVSSKKEGLAQERTIILIFRHHVVIEFYPEPEHGGYTKGFLIRNQLTPFYYD